MTLPLAYTPFFDAILENFGGWGLGMLLVLGIDMFFVSALVLALILIFMLPAFRFRQAAFAVFKRNFVGYFNSPIGYVFLCMFVLLTSLAAFWPHEFFASNLANLDQLNRWLPYIMLTFIPAITMSIWADEKRQGTDELMLTLPATDYEIVIGKYFACVGIFTVSLVFSQVWNYCVLAALTAGQMDVGLIMTTYLGYWFIGLAMLAVGMVASFLTRNLTIAFIFGVVFNAPLAFLADLDLLLPNSWLLNQIQQWSLLDKFDTFGRGVISISPVFYFIGIVVLGVYISLVLIGRRHWSGARDGLIRLVHYLVRIACIVLLVIGMTTIGQYSKLNQWRTDQSEGQVSSLSVETVRILKELSERKNEDGGDPSPIVIDAYVSDDVPPEYVRTRYDLISLLREFDALGGDRISLNLYTGVEPFSETADAAEKSFKIRPVQVTSENRGMVRTERLVMGASFRCGLERVTIPFFTYGSPVEYELIRSINTVATSERRKIGVLRTPANLMGGTIFNGRQYQRLAPQQIIIELEKQYDVKSVEPARPIDVWLKDETTGEEKLKHDVLIVAQPSALTPLEMQHLVAAIKDGQPVIIFEDPAPQLISVLGTNQRSEGRSKCDMGELWRTLNIEPKQVFGETGKQLSLISQDYNPYPQIEAFSQTPEYVFIRDQSDQEQMTMSRDSPVTSGLEELLFPQTGAITRVGEKYDFIPLVMTSMASELPLEDWYAARRDPRALEALRGKESGRFVLAAEIAGKITSQQKPVEAVETAREEKEPESLERDLHAIYVADLDMLTSGIVRIWSSGFSQDGTVFRIQNGIMLLNMVDYMVGDQDTYIAIRSRQRSHTTLRRIEQLIEIAQAEVIEAKQNAEREFTDEYNDAQAEVEQGLGPLRKKLDLLIAQNADRSQVNITRERLRLKSEAISKQLLAKRESLQREKDAKVGDIERRMELDIQKMQTDFKVWAAFLPPILPMVIGFIVYAKRRLREREGVSKARLR